MSIVGLHHVQVNVPEASETETRHFYEQLLGLSPMPRPESLAATGRRGVWYRCGDGEFHVFFNPDANSDANSSSRHPGLLVEDLNALRRRLQKASIELEEAIPIDGRQRFFCRDPGGNRLEFLAFG